MHVIGFVCSALKQVNETPPHFEMPVRWHITDFLMSHLLDVFIYVGDKKKSFKRLTVVPTYLMANFSLQGTLPLFVSLKRA